MADNVSKNRRSQIMRLVKSKDTKLEIKFRNALRKLGYKFKRNVGNYFGKPDFVLSESKTAIFVDSCFWHGCAKHCRLPSSRKKYWFKKIERNKKRDTEVSAHYKRNGWKIVRIWEHSLKDISAVAIRIKNILKKRSAGIA